MKKLILTIAVVVVLMGIPDKALADVWSRCGLRSSRGFQLGGRRFLGGSFRTPLGSFRTPSGNVWNRCGLPSRGGFAYYGRDRSTLGEVLDCVGSGMNVLGALNQMSVTNRVVNMHEKEQAFRHQQIRAERCTVPIRRIRREPVVVLQIKEPEQTQTTKTQKNENHELQQKIRILELELEKLKLQQELQKEAKK